MSKFRNSLRLFPCCLFLFFSIFISVKFIFIFFFRAAYEPSFMFNFTPFYLFSGISSTQLLFLSLGMIWVDTLLHFKATKRNLLLSYFPSSIIISGLGIAMVLNEASVSYLFHYLIFCLLLLAILIDHNHILKSDEISTMALPKQQQKKHRRERQPFTPFSTSKQKQAMRIPSEPGLVTGFTQRPMHNDSYEAILKNIQSFFEVLERRAVNLEKLENEYEERKNNLIRQEEMLIDRLSCYLKSKERTEEREKTVVKEQSVVHQVPLNEKITNHLVIDESSECLVVVQRGILKQVSNTFANVLGYNTEELVNKKLFIFLTPDGMKNVKQYCENRLKGVVVNSYTTVLLTKNYDQIPVEIIVQPTEYNGESAELLLVKEIKKNV